MEEGSGSTFILDRSGRGNLMFKQAADMAQVAGKVGFAQNFERNLGDNNGFVLPIGSDLGMLSTEFFVGLWVQMESLPGVGMCAAARRSDTEVDWEIRCRQNDRFEFTMSDLAEGGIEVTVESPVARAAGVWYFIAAWHDRAQGKALLKVNEEATVSAPCTTSGSAFDNPAASIGARDPGDPWDGSIDQVMVMRRALAPHEIAAYYNQGFGVSYRQLQRRYRNRRTA
jgi:hypothetical protein